MTFLLSGRHRRHGPSRSARTLPDLDPPFPVSSADFTSPVMLYTGLPSALADPEIVPACTRLCD